jgi:multicomponent Na+:H+ antiporter subunit F
VSPWDVAIAVLLLAMLPGLLLILRGPAMHAIVAMEMISVLAVAVLLLFAAADSDPALADPALVLALLSLGSGLVYLRFFEHWI